MAQRNIISTYNSVFNGLRFNYAIRIVMFLSLLHLPSPWFRVAGFTGNR